MLDCGLTLFPSGAEGFGKWATGGRGGRVIYVTNRNHSGPGSLNAALAESGPRTVLCKVDGVFEPGTQYSHITRITQDDVTIAGHTAPGGIVVRGLLTDAEDGDNGVKNVIIRHIRSRPNHGAQLDDGCRIHSAQNVMIDHCSFQLVCVPG